MYDRKFTDEERQGVIDVVAAAGPKGALISDVVAHASKDMSDKDARRLVRQVLDTGPIHTTRTFRLRHGTGWEQQQRNGGDNDPAE
jgi:hypothetical protein